MRKIANFALTLSLVVTATLPTFSQRQTPASRGGRSSAKTQFESVRAMTDGSGVLVRWQMKVETGVAGYKVYRDGGTEPVNPSFVMGSAGRFGDRTAFGEFYQFFDLEGTPASTYRVEGRRLDGTAFGAAPAPVAVVKDLETEVGTSSETFRNARLSKNSDIQSRTATLSGELQDLVSLYEQEPNLENQFRVASLPGARISVRKDGFYRVTAAELATADFPVTSDPTKWRLFMNGNEQSIIVAPGGEYIEFYGRGLDIPESDIRQYFLIADIVPGKRIASRVVRSVPGGAESFRYPVVAGKKERSNHYNKFFNGDGENFLGRLFSDTRERIYFNLSGVDLSTPNAQIKISLYGFSPTVHRILTKINGNDLPDITQHGYVFYDQTFTIPTSHLVEGENELEMKSHAAFDFNLFDKVEVAYSRTYVADADKLSFFTPGYRKVDLEGFSSSNVRVFDLTFEGNPVLLANIPVVEAETGYTATIPSSRMMVGYAVENTALMQSPGITKNLPSTLAAASNRADMLIISHSTPSFMAASEAWAAYRRSSQGGGHAVDVIDVADIYDEFGYGTIGAGAIRAFLEHTGENWTAGSPKYVLLMGDSTYDPRNYEGYGNFYLIPSKEVRLILEESISDEALGDFDDDGLSTMAIGRIPARTSAQIAIAFDKVKKYEANQQSFNRGALFAHDSPLGYDFEGMNVQLSQRLPAGTPFSMVSAGEQFAHENLIARMNEGKFVVNYSGHGSAGLWANSSFFNIAAVSELTNLNNPSMYSMLTCLNGYFVRTNAESISESLIFSPTGGAAAAWASSSETTPDIQETMAIKFFEELSDGPIAEVGDLIKEAKTVIDAGADVRLSWVLIGDPAMRMP